MARGGKPKVRRGGGRSFSRHLELNEEGTAVGVDPRSRKRDGGEVEEEGDEDDIEEESEEEDEEESEEEEALPPTAVPQQQELSRADRKALKKQGKKKEVVEDEDGNEDPLLANPNRTVGRMKISDLEVSREPTRKEREAKENAEAKEKYMKLHAQGKTEQAQKDLARLTKIRAEREAAQAKRKAEAEAKAAEVEAKKATGRR